MNEQSKLSRRRIFAGAGTLGAVAAVATLLPAVEPAATAAHASDDNKRDAAAGKAAGYRLTAHVKRYYETTKV